MPEKNKKHIKKNLLTQKNQENAMTTAREMIPLMSQTSDSLGSYTGTPDGETDKMPVQDADDL